MEKPLSIPFDTCQGMAGKRHNRFHPLGGNEHHQYNNTNWHN